MDHGSNGGMKHGHGGMEDGGMDHSMPMKCSMNMLWNSQISGTCVVFERWSIQTWWGMVVSCAAVTFLSFLYLHLLHVAQQQDKRTAIQLYLGQRPETSLLIRTSVPALNADRDHDGSQAISRSESPLPGGRSGNLGIQKLPSSIRLFRAILYATTMALSFFLMLVAMTYNTYLFFSIILGGFIGHWTYESEMNVGAVMNGQQVKGYACH
ncbi:hypothetical protein FFLO_01894 [Filobasidium floriforme]|uniref:Copper transport protein n=1 Tax=Filobasidium floriforme TaxID=5210 RepID=A0A8K0JPA9_9TREE|nr:Ctr copper transporter family-domain-containing protein [Filobasidium floriforme]KAG7562627.1 hypothetical protein FFLO_01894 [Filobasidium floriforme]KAH8089434.1 Ctr copper transporter family-domain-containing protein [Filobasidium floriforme]